MRVIVTKRADHRGSGLAWKRQKNREAFVSSRRARDKDVPELSRRRNHGWHCLGNYSLGLIKRRSSLAPRFLYLPAVTDAC